MLVVVTKCFELRGNVWFFFTLCNGSLVLFKEMMDSPKVWKVVPTHAYIRFELISQKCGPFLSRYGDNPFLFLENVK